jgi:membrane protein DedA with SNARE-associated domain
MHIFFSKIAGWIVVFISFLGYPGVVLLMAAESACIPVPSEIIIPFSGYLVSVGRFSLLGVVFFGTLGQFLGSVLIYVLARKHGRPWVEKYGTSLFISKNHLKKADLFFQKYGDFSVFFGRLLPVVRTFISLPAGLTRVPFIRFCSFTLMGSFLWCLALAYCGMILGDHWKKIAPYFHDFDFLLFAAFILGLGWWLWKEHRISSRNI